MHSTLAELRTEIANAKKVSSSKARLKGDYGAYLGEICTTLEGKLFCSVCSEFAAGSGLEALTTVDPPQKYETIANDTGWYRGRSRRAGPNPGTSARDGVGQGLGWDGVGGVARARETTPAGETRAISGLSAPPRS